MNSKERSYETCIEMLTQRGYRINKLDESHLDASHDTREHIRVFFTDDDNFNTKQMKTIINIMSDESIRHGIIVYPKTITPAAKNILTRTFDRQFELFNQQELQLNITKHRLQPIFRKVDEEEQLRLTEQFGDNLAKMEQDRPISRFFNYRKGILLKSRGNVEI